MFTSREDGWEKEKDEGPLKLKELHKKVRKEKEGYYVYEYEQTFKPKPRKEEKGLSSSERQWLQIR